MQHNQPGERALGKEQAMPFPRTRAGTRASMRVTNRYTMPPLAPRGQQHSDPLRNTEGQDEQIASTSYKEAQPFSTAEEDAWLNDVLPPSRPVRPPSPVGMSGETKTVGGTRGSEEFRANGEVRASEKARADGEDGASREVRMSEKTRATVRVAPAIHAPDGLPAEYGRGDPRGRPDSNDRPGFSNRPGSYSRPGFSPVVSDPVWPGHRLWSVVFRLSERVCQELGHRQAVVERLDAEVEALARECAVDILRSETALAAQVHNLTEAEQVMQAVVDEVSGFGPLASLWRDDAVTEIMAVGPRFTVVERNGDMREVACRFEDEQHMVRIVGNILRDAGRVFDPAAMITNARLSDGSFISVIMPPGAVKGPTLTLRKRIKHVLTLPELVKLEMLSEPMAEFLMECVGARLNIVICGGLRSGRTTLLNALAALIPAAERIVTIEDVAELQFEQKQVIALEARLLAPDAREQEHGNSAGMRELLFNALRLRPERLVVGDCWNDEAGVLLSALHSGYAGSLFNMYANGLQDCLNRLEMMWLSNRPATPLAVTREQVARVVDIVVYLARLSNGTRKVINIAEVVGVQEGRIKARSMFHYKEHSEGQGRFEPGGFVPTRLPASRHSRLMPDVFIANPATEARQGQAPPPVRA